MVLSDIRRSMSCSRVADAGMDRRRRLDPHAGHVSLRSYSNV